MHDACSMTTNILNLSGFKVRRVEEADHDYHVYAEVSNPSGVCMAYGSDRLIGCDWRERAWPTAEASPQRSTTAWDALGRFLQDGTVSIDNNHIERLMRPWAMGCKAWLFAGSERAGQCAAMVMSLLPHRLGAANLSRCGGSPLTKAHGWA